MRKEDKVFYSLAGIWFFLFFMFFVLLCIIGEKALIHFKSDCDAKGGQLVYLKTGYFCIAKGVILK